MAIGHRARNLVSSRRRVDDNYDAASVESDSHSESSVLTDIADKREQRSEAHETLQTKTATKPAAANNKNMDVAILSTEDPYTAGEDIAILPRFSLGADTDVMMNGLEIPPGNHDEDIIQFDDDDIEEYIPNAPMQEAVVEAGPRAPGPNALPRRDLVSHGVTKQAPQPQAVGKGHLSRASESLNIKAQPRWSHDLHETVKEPARLSKSASRLSRGSPPKPHSLSSTLVVGLVTMRVALPGMTQPILYEKMPVRYHVRLPDLRPPLRRDKPVRVSIEDNPPRYIFPNVERSFIFIPRAQRPNQQNSRYRNRPHVSQFSSRRGSVYGGSNQGASGAVSRRSSIAREGLISPTASGASHAPFGAPLGPANRPVVRLPTSAGPMSNVSSQTANGGGAGLQMPYPLPARPTLRENRQVSLPMHQPRPQKAVSLDTLETPRPDQLQAPQQQEQQPFHQQVPGAVFDVPEQHSDYSQMSQQQVMDGLSSMLPEQAVNAQPFQPAPWAYYPPAYAAQSPYYYYSAPNEGSAVPYGHAPMAPYGMYTQTGPFMLPVLAAPSMSLQGGSPDADMYPRESNGSVYFYNSGGGAFNGEQTGGGAGTYALAPAEGGMKPDAPEFFFQPNGMMFYAPR